MSESLADAESLIEGGDPHADSQSDPTADSSSSSKTAVSTLISSVDEALKGSESEESPTSEPGKADKAAPPTLATDDDPLGELTDTELNRYGPRTQRRIRQLLSDRSELSGEVERLRGKAEAFDQFDGFIQQNRITNEDLSVLLEIGALVRNDPFAARDRLTAIVSELDKVTGHQLPADLSERVRLGYISEQDAREIVQARSKANFAEQRAREVREQSQNVESQQRLAAHVDVCRRTANEWESRHKSTDPDWQAKQDEIGKLIELEVYRNGYPPNQDAVVRMLDGFLQTVNAKFAQFRPKPRAVNPVSGSASSRANSAAAPKTLMEAVDRALAQ